MELLKLYFVFFKVGLFTIGGGLAAIPLLQNYAYEYGWVSESAFANMIAISQSTPGPIGINMATYVGFNQHFIIGSIVATLGIVSPAFIIIGIIARFLENYKNNRWVKIFLKGIRPVVVGIILTAAYSIGKITLFRVDAFLDSGSFVELFDYKSCIVFILFLYLIERYNKHPVIYILVASVVGVILW